MAGYIGSTSGVTGIPIGYIGSTGLGGNLVIPDDGTIGSASDTDAITIDASGNVTLGGNLILPSGGGISFENHSVSVVTGTSSTTSANVLNDCEQGTWAPIPINTYNTSTWTSYSSYGNYLKLGSLVFCTFSLQFNNLVVNGNIGFTNLPFSGSHVAGANGVARITNISGHLVQIENISGYQISVMRKYDNGSLPNGNPNISGVFTYIES